MNYFNYNPPGDKIGVIWGLFAKLGDLSEEEILNKENLKYTHILDIINSALKDNIDLSPDGIRDFNLSGYEFMCQKNGKISSKKKVDKEVYIVYDTTEDISEKVKFGDVSERRIKSTEDMFDEVLDNATFEQNLDALFSIRTSYIVKEGVDIVNLLYNAIIGVKTAMEYLAVLVRENSKLAEIIESLCSGNKHDVLVGRLKVS